ncbi:serine protease [Neiella sp. HB171785]|uniref:Serine protease n=1 Tax=Neiella litorisoli TaxID=2771431 RepID=A0A8J6UJC0_9GAMM|nr:serine protease [Neiella litorisoli]MBD1390348.1 serine protease [Neiella litorisoli]
MKFSVALKAVLMSLCCLTASAQQLSTEPTKIIGGEPTEITRYGWLASIQYIGNDGQFIDQSQHFCGGVQVNSDWVLTAAHCLTSFGLGPDELAVAVGIARQAQVNRSNLKRVEQFIVHPQYDEQTNDNDVALIKLAQANPLNDYPKLATSAATAALANGDDLLVLGWGDTEEQQSPVNQLMQATVAYVEPQQCRSEFNRTGVDITDNMLCAGGNNSADTCFGDSGGPLLNPLNQIFGITSWGIECGGRFPSGYARVASYLQWIDETTAGVVATSPQYFGLLPIGESVMRTVLITNQATTTAIDLGQAVLAGNSYSVITDDCSNQTLLAQQQCVLEVQFDARSLNSTAGVINMETSKEPIEIDLVADVAAMVSFDNAAVPAELTTFAFGQSRFEQQGDALLASLAAVGQDETDLLIQFAEAGQVSLNVSFSNDDGQSLWISELNGDVLAIYSSEDGAFDYRVASGDILQLNYSVTEVGTATIRDIEFIPDQAPADDCCNNNGTNNDTGSQSGGGGGSVGALSVVWISALLWTRRQRWAAARPAAIDID